MTPRLHFLSWDRPLLPQAVDLLAANWAGNGPLDLSGLLVVVPTKQAGRRLREALAAHAHTRGQAVFPPRVVPPETLATLGVPAAGIASRLASQLAWIAVLRNLSLEEFRAVFPLDPPARDFAWARRLAIQFMQLQATLAEAGLRLAGVNARAGQDFPETERWTQLAVLEQRYDEALAAHQLRDNQAAKLAFATAPSLPPNIKKIILLATPDPLPLATRILARYAEEVPVEIGVCGPADEPVESLFDEWGRPRAKVWAQRVLGWPDFEQRVWLHPDPAAQAEQIVALTQSYAAPEGLLAIGAADSEVLAPLENGLGRAGVPVFNPEGRPRKRDGLHALLVLLADFARADEFASAAALLRCPDVLDWLGPRLGPEFSRARLLEELDELNATHLPPTLMAARKHTGKFPLAAGAFVALEGMRAGLTKGKFPENVLAVLANLFAPPRVEAAELLAESAEAWQKVTDETSRALAAFPGLSRADGWELALEVFAEDKATADKSAGALELNGWLELLWEDAPHLVVAGLNDGSVPLALAVNTFLPESLRDRLGLQTNAVRFTRDAYLLAALGARRAKSGRLDLLLGKVSAAGDPLRPSRLLLCCPDAELPRRIEFLFRNVETAQASLPWMRAWPLRPRVVPPPAKLSVTAVRDYLACPFRFYLKHVLRMEPVDLMKAELTARDYGTLLHVALQAMGEDEKLRDCADEAVLRDTLLAVFERCVRDRYDNELTLPLVVQFESARQRLRAAAAVQARECATGWRIERVEWSFALSLGGLTVRGKIDRLDRHTDGRMRVLDYKSADSPLTPAARHLGPVGAGEARPAWARVMAGGKERVWRDLQLPLYRRAVAAEFGPAVACGYFNLPKAAGDTAVVLWGDLSPDLQVAAESCAEQVAAAVAAAKFWPPAELDPRSDEDWAGLLQHGAAASVAAEWAQGGAR
ncbi:MAG: PD-(D/E)XK nuclease family protein [Lacunisphaera sp.]|nr:PD-(D/E)XK nuclease family protein [Lacunisphaera sp.]